VTFEERQSPTSLLAFLAKDYLLRNRSKAGVRIDKCRDFSPVGRLALPLSIAIVAGIAFLYRHVLLVNQTTVALTLLLAILAVSAVWGNVVSVFMSVAAMLVFNYEFLPRSGI